MSDQPLVKLSPEMAKILGMKPTVWRAGAVIEPQGCAVIIALAGPVENQSSWWYWEPINGALSENWMEREPEKLRKKIAPPATPLS